MIAGIVPVPVAFSSGISGLDGLRIPAGLPESAVCLREEEGTGECDEPAELTEELRFPFCDPLRDSDTDRFIDEIRP